MPWSYAWDFWKLFVVDFPNKQPSQNFRSLSLSLLNTPCFPSILRLFILICPSLRCHNLVMFITTFIVTLDSPVTTSPSNKYNLFFLILFHYPCFFIKDI